MKGTLTKIVVGTITVISGGAYVPIVPVELSPGLAEHPQMRAYQYHVEKNRRDTRPVATTTKNGDEIVLVDFGPSPDADFTDEDGNGLISVAVFTDRLGQNVYKKISDAEYAQIGQKDGYKNNPTKTELITVLETFTDIAEAAISFNSRATGWANSASSLTYAAYATGTNNVIVNGIWGFNSTANYTGTTYNGVALTELGNVATDGTGGRLYLNGIVVGASTTANIVISYDGNKQIFGNTLGYGGASQSAPFPDTAVTSSLSSRTTHTITMTTTVADSWLINLSRHPSRLPVASTGTVIRSLNPVSADAGAMEDSNGGRSAGSNSLEYTVSPAQVSYNVMVALAPYVETATGLAPGADSIIYY